MPAPTQALETSAFALCTARLGRQSNDQDLIQHSLNLYTQGLNQLQRALWDPRMMYKDETLGACMLLAMYELVECPSNGRSGFLSHHNGCARLIQLRGAEAHATGLGHSIFIHFRVIGVRNPFLLLLQKRQFRLLVLLMHATTDSRGLGFEVDLSYRSPMEDPAFLRRAKVAF
jgi:hypothetical protein